MTPELLEDLREKVETADILTQRIEWMYSSLSIINSALETDHTFKISIRNKTLPFPFDAEMLTEIREVFVKRSYQLNQQLNDL